MGGCRVPSGAKTKILKIQRRDLPLLSSSVQFTLPTPLPPTLTSSITVPAGRDIEVGAVDDEGAADRRLSTARWSPPPPAPPESPTRSRMRDTACVGCARVACRVSLPVTRSLPRPRARTHAHESGSVTRVERLGGRRMAHMRPLRRGSPGGLYHGTLGRHAVSAVCALQCPYCTACARTACSCGTLRSAAANGSRDGNAPGTNAQCWQPQNTRTHNTGSGVCCRVVQIK